MQSVGYECSAHIYKNIYNLVGSELAATSLMSYFGRDLSEPYRFLRVSGQQIYGIFHEKSPCIPFPAYSPKAHLYTRLGALTVMGGVYTISQAVMRHLPPFKEQSFTVRKILSGGVGVAAALYAFSFVDQAIDIEEVGDLLSRVIPSAVILDGCVTVSQVGLNLLAKHSREVGEVIGTSAQALSSALGHLKWGIIKSTTSIETQTEDPSVAESSAEQSKPSLSKKAKPSSKRVTQDSLPDKRPPDPPLSKQLPNVPSKPVFKSNSSKRPDEESSSGDSIKRREPKNLRNKQSFPLQVSHSPTHPELSERFYRSASDLPEKKNSGSGIRRRVSAPLPIPFASSSREKADKKGRERHTVQKVTERFRPHQSSNHYLHQEEEDLGSAEEEVFSVEEAESSEGSGIEVSSLEKQDSEGYASETSSNGSKNS